MRTLNLKEKVCFACLNDSNLFLSYILSKTAYENNYKILILSDHYGKETYSRIIRDCSIWDEVVLINEAGRNPEDIARQLKQMDFSNIDVLHYFAFAQKSYTSILFDYIPKDTRIILTVYCIVTYYFKEYYLNYIKNINSVNIDLNRVSEVWVYDERLYTGELLKGPVKSMDIFEYLNNEELLSGFCNELNAIFGYTHRLMDYDVMFFDQSITSRFINADKEKRLFSTVLNAFDNRKVVVKLHPNTHSVWKYNDFKVSIINEKRLPWEVILINELKYNKSNLKNKIFATYFSESLFTTRIFLKNLNLSCKTIWLRDVLQKNTKTYLGIKEDSEIFFFKQKTAYEMLM